MKKKADTAAKGRGGGKCKSRAAIPEHEIESLARCLLPAIRGYYETDEGRDAFEEWERKRSGGKT